MRARINLFQEELFAVRNDWLDAGKAFWIMAVALTLLLLGAAVLWMQEYALLRQAGHLQEEEQILKNRLSQMQAAFPKNEEDPALAERLSQLEAEIKVKKQVLELLSGQKIGNRQGFSAQFTRLAQESFPDLWLTQVQFLDGGRQLVFVGHTLQTASLFDFVKHVTADGIFKGQQFPYFQIDTVQTNTPQTRAQLRFGFSTQRETLQEAWKSDQPPTAEEGSASGKEKKGEALLDSLNKIPENLVGQLLKQVKPQEKNK
ncbi:MAG: hypothetical protein H7837_10730 [Magnetococcus sp. MYC-9]